MEKHIRQIESKGIKEMKVARFSDGVTSTVDGVRHGHEADQYPGADQRPGVKSYKVESYSKNKSDRRVDKHEVSIPLLAWQRVRNFPLRIATRSYEFRDEFFSRLRHLVLDERGDVPGWVLVVLMTTGLVTGIWTIAAPRIQAILRGSLDAMNNVR